MLSTLTPASPPRASPRGARRTRSGSGGVAPVCRHCDAAPGGHGHARVASANTGRAPSPALAARRNSLPPPPPPPPSRPLARARSDGAAAAAPTPGGSLQTIEGQSRPSDPETPSSPTRQPPPPRHLVNRPHLPVIPAMPPPAPGAAADPSPVLHRPRHPSDYSYYSVDAGKHGFLSHHPPHRHHREPHSPSHPSRHPCDRDRDGDDDSQDGARSASNDSLVFKYEPGQETPPAEYALPASILGVYGVDCRLAAVPAAAEEARNDADTAKTSDAPGDPVSPTSLRVPHLLPDLAVAVAAEGGDGGVDFFPAPARILPYHERKRLSAERAAEAEAEAEGAAGRKGGRRGGRRSGRRGGGRGAGACGDRDGFQEATPLAAGSQADGGYGTALDNGTVAASDGAGNIDHDAWPGWFGRLLSIVTGKADPAPPQSSREARREPPPRRPARDEPQGEREEEQERTARTYRDRGRAFIERSEPERQKRRELKELLRRAKHHRAGHSRARRSSLESIPSWGSHEDGTEEDGTGEEGSASSDEESGTSYYFEEENEPRPRVWKYGEPPTNPAPQTPAASAAGHSSSRCDRVMRRERLLQEEYEYRLVKLKRENDRLSRRFRACVLVAVAGILAGGLAFAFAVCLRMLLA